MSNSNGAIRAVCDERSGRVTSFTLYGSELLDREQSSGPELIVNGLPLKTRLYPRAETNTPLERFARLKGERYVDHFTAWGLVVARSMGERKGLKHGCFGVQYRIRREQAGQDGIPCPGPGGPPIEAPLHVDTFTLLNWNWTFWGEDTLMIFPSAHSNGPWEIEGHVGYDHDTPENCKKYMTNDRRRIYPGTMLIHGGVFYNRKTGHWLALTCRRPHVGYVLNLETAGRGVSYDFTLHAPFGMGEALTLPEIRMFFGNTEAGMWDFMADYVTHYYRQAPEWVTRTLWLDGLAWNNEPTWREQAGVWEKKVESGECTGISYSLVTNRPVLSGTTPTGYEPDPLHGTADEFRAMCRRLADRGVPLLIWMSHSGLMHRGGIDIDDDWFIYGIDGRICASWGDDDNPQLAHINPGHPGYIEYTKKWIRFYMKECGAKGMFFDCLGWGFPCDFRPRSFMRYPGDTNRMAIKFIEEIAACVKECDPEGILLGEGSTLDAPLDVLSLNMNPARGVDGRGPRDFILALNARSPKRVAIDQGPAFSIPSGMVRALPGPENAERNRLLAGLLKKHGGGAFEHLSGELAILPGERLLVVPHYGKHAMPGKPEFRLPDPWSGIERLTDAISGTQFARNARGLFTDLPGGIYRM